jgi:lysophospholipase L1-like esterase
MTIESLRRQRRLRRLRRLFAGEENFLPSDLANLAVWLETSPRTGYLYTDTGLTAQAADTNVVKGWRDHGPAGLHLTEATNGPTLDFPFDATDLVNGRGALVCDGTNDVLTGAAAADWDFLHNGTGCELFCTAIPEAGMDGVLLDTAAAATNRGLAMMCRDDVTAGTGRLAAYVFTGAGTSAFSLQAQSASDVWPGGELHCGGYSMAAGETARIYVDNCQVASATQTNAPNAGAATNALKIGKGLAAAFDAHKYCAIVGFSRRLTDVERGRMVRYSAARYGHPAFHIGCLGDSITSGEAVATTYPTRIAQRLGPLWAAYNHGVSGDKLADQYADWSSTPGIKDKTRNCISVLCGLNDVGGGRTLDQMTADATTLFDAILAEVDRDLVLCTIMPWADSTAWSAAKQTITEQYNDFVRDYVRQHSARRVGLVDLYEPMGSPSDPTKLHPLWNVNDVHPNQAGSDYIAERIAEKALELALPAGY